MKRKKLAILSFALSAVWPLVAQAHTDSVGFLVQTSAVTTCVGGTGTTCYDVEIFYGTWHTGTQIAEGDLAIWLQNSGGGETQVVGQSATGGSTVPFSRAHSLTGVIPNSDSTITYNYSVVPSTDYTNLNSVFALGTDYFFADSSSTSLQASPVGISANVYGHQSAIAVGLGPGTYRIAYDAATSGGLSATWRPVSAIQTATFTITGGGGVVVDTGAPSVALTGPGGAQSSTYTVTATFSEPVTGVTLSDFVVGNGTAANLVAVSSTVYTVNVTPTTTTGVVTVDFPATSAIDVDSNPNTASNTFSTPTSAGVSAQDKNEIAGVIRQETVRTLRGQLAANQRATKAARDRFIAAQRCRQFEKDPIKPGAATIQIDRDCGGLVTRNNIPFDMTGTAVATSRNANVTGSFFGQTGNYEGTRRRLVFGDFDLTRYSDGGVIGTLRGRVAWERMVTGDQMLGYFLGASLSRSDIAGSYTGTRDAFGVSAGAYLVKQLDDGLYADGFATVGAGLNNLDMGNGTIDLKGDYLTKSIQLGAALSGRIKYETFELRPELSLAYGYTDIGNVDFGATTLGTSLTDTLNAGYVALATLSLTPEFLIPLDISSAVYDKGKLRISPSLTCEFIDALTSSTNCGGGLELEVSANSDDGESEISLKLQFEKIGQATRQSVGFSYQHNF